VFDQSAIAPAASRGVSCRRAAPARRHFDHDQRADDAASGRVQKSPQAVDVDVEHHHHEQEQHHHGADVDQHQQMARNSASAASRSRRREERQHQEQLRAVITAARTTRSSAKM
jgi:hypothetical protein